MQLKYRSFDTMEEYRQWCERSNCLTGWAMAALEYAGKEASNRAKDRETLPRLRSFREYWIERQRRTR